MGGGGSEAVLTAAFIVAIAACLFAFISVVVLAIIARRRSAQKLHHQQEQQQKQQKQRAKRDQLRISIPAGLDLNPKFPVMDPPDTSEYRINDDDDRASETFALQKAWPLVARALAEHIRNESDPVDRVKAAVDLGGLGGVDAARLLVDAVRDGSISPLAGAHALSRSGFTGGVVLGSALNDDDASVQLMVRLVLDGAMDEADS